VRADLYILMNFHGFLGGLVGRRLTCWLDPLSLNPGLGWMEQWRNRMRIRRSIPSSSVAAASRIHTTTTITITTSNIPEITNTSPTGDDIGDAPDAVDVGRQHDRPTSRPRCGHGRPRRRRRHQSHRPTPAIVDYNADDNGP